MRINTFAICYNEELRIPWYLENYSFANHHYIYDQHSTDNTIKLLKGNSKVTIIPFGSKDKLENKEYLKIKNHCWKGSRADWIIVGDIDELLYHPDLLHLLETTDATILMPSAAYSMVSEQTPKHYSEMVTGYVDPGYMKACLFRPSEIEEMRYSPGCHKLSPVGNVIIGHGKDLTMYHYSHPGFEWTVKRYAMCGARRSEEDRKNGWGVQFSYGRERIRKFFDKHAADPVRRVWQSQP